MQYKNDFIKNKLICETNKMSKTKTTKTKNVLTIKNVVNEKFVKYDNENINDAKIILCYNLIHASQRHEKCRLRNVMRKKHNMYNALRTRTHTTRDNKTIVIDANNRNDFIDYVEMRHIEIAKRQNALKTK